MWGNSIDIALDTLPSLHCCKASIPLVFHILDRVLKVNHFPSSFCPSFSLNSASIRSSALDDLCFACTSLDGRFIQKSSHYVKSMQQLRFVFKKDLSDWFSFDYDLISCHFKTHVSYVVSGFGIND
jgi:hypothetical protein